MSDIITFNLIIDLNELYLYLSRRLAGLKEAVRAAEGAGKHLPRIFGRASDTTSALR